MKKIILFCLPILLGCLVFFITTTFLAKSASGKGALQVTSTPQSTLFLNGKKLGITPFYSDSLRTGNYALQLVPTDKTYQAFAQPISINPSVLTVVDRTFKDGLQSHGSIITLVPITDKKHAQVAVVTFPIGVTVALDSGTPASSPVLLNDVTQSDHILTFSKEGYKNESVHIHAIVGYKIEVTVFLVTDLQPTATESATTVVASAEATLNQKIIILDTPTGFLRVRENPSLNGSEIGRVNPSEIYSVLSEKDEWFEIKLADGKTGWISATYAKKQ